MVYHDECDERSLKCGLRVRREARLEDKCEERGVAVLVEGGDYLLT